MRNVNVNGFEKIYMGEDLIEGKLYQIIDQFNERKITSIILLNKIHKCYNRNGRTGKILFANDDKTNFFNEATIKKLNNNM